jgi:hypothetical protein
MQVMLLGPSRAQADGIPAIRRNRHHIAGLPIQEKPLRRQAIFDAGCQPKLLKMHDVPVMPGSPFSRSKICSIGRPAAPAFPRQCFIISDATHISIEQARIVLPSRKKAIAIAAQGRFGRPAKPLAASHPPIRKIQEIQKCARQRP